MRGSRGFRFCCSCFAVAWLGVASATTEPVGHWEGALTVEGHEVAIVVDIEREKKDTFTGEIDVPDQAVRNLALENISSDGRSVSFRMSKVPGDPVFNGSFGDDGKTISGTLTQSGESFPFALKRTGNATLGALPKDGIKLVDKGIPGKGAEGEWHGVLEAGATKLRLIVYIAHGSDGPFKGTMDSVDQGAKAIVLDPVRFEGGVLHFEVASVHGTFEGTMSADGSTIRGTWVQGESSLPLDLLRAGK